MLISPPFLPDEQVQSADDAFIEMQMPAAAHGSYPVGRGFAWHGGVHLRAPTDGGNIGAPARAIADGKVKLVVQPKPMQIAPPYTPDAPQNYYGGWTDNGCVVVEHTTDIGDGVSVTFYAIYQHLHQIDAKVNAGQPIWRKDPIGQAGYIYGEPHHLHFEIVCDDANLEKLIGRASGKLDLSKDGRRSVVFGDIYVRVPAGADIYDADPQAPAPRHHNARHAAPRAVAVTAETTIVGIHYAKGDAVLTSYVPSPNGNGWLARARSTDRHAEYELFKEARRRFPGCASAGYEVLRFGRVIGNSVTLAAGESAHWRKIAYRDATGAWQEGYVDLNATGTTKFSDADFPHWRDWQLADDDTDGDSRCTSAVVRQCVLDDGTTCYDEAMLDQRVRLPEVQAKLRKLIAKFPSEWEPGTTDKRWSWLKTDDAVAAGLLAEPMTDESFAELAAHDEALSFFKGLGLSGTHWHFDPREFVKVFKRCGWLGLDEMRQALPRNSGASAAGTITWFETVTRLERGETKVRPPKQVPPGMRLQINRVLRIYGIADDLRRAHFLSQGFQETAVLSLLHEKGTDEYFTRYDHQPVAGWLGNTQSGDGARFKGRGLLHLTGRAHYCDYGKSCSQDYETDTTAPLLQSEAFVACDSGGWFWTVGNSGKGDPVQRADQGASDADVERVTRAVNGGTNGLPNRKAYFTYLWHLFRDVPNVPVSGVLILQQLQRP